MADTPITDGKYFSVKRKFEEDIEERTEYREKGTVPRTFRETEEMNRNLKKKKRSIMQKEEEDVRNHSSSPPLLLRHSVCM